MITENFGVTSLGEHCDMTGNQIAEYIGSLEYQSWEDYLEVMCNGEQYQCNDPLLNVSPLYCGYMYNCPSQPQHCMNAFTYVLSMLNANSGSTSLTAHDWMNAFLFYGNSMNNGGWITTGTGIGGDPDFSIP